MKKSERGTESSSNYNNRDNKMMHIQITNKKERSNNRQKILFRV